MTAARRPAAPRFLVRLAPTLPEDLSGGAALFLLLWAALVLPGPG